MTPKSNPPHKRAFMYLSYVDDSGTSGCNLDDKKVPFQVVGGPIIHEDLYGSLETRLAVAVESLVPEEQWDSFEFHACDLFNGAPPFESIEKDKRHSLISTALEWIRKLNIPVLYGAIDKGKLKTQIFSSAKPMDIAFRLYLQTLDEWFEATYEEKYAKNVSDTKEWPRGLLISDDSRKEVRNDMQRALRENLSKPKAGQNPNGLGMHVFDDVYFGDSKNSTGLQLADICVYVIARHLGNKPEAQGFYDIISEQIFRPKLFP